MKVAHSSTTSTDAVPAPHPAEPKQRLHAVVTDAVRTARWGHIPTAPTAPASYTRAQVQEQLAATASDDDWKPGPAIPPFPHQRPKPGTKPKLPGQRGAAYEAIILGYGEPAWKTAFGSAA